jgi:hypothetical protein
MRRTKDSQGPLPCMVCFSYNNQLFAMIEVAALEYSRFSSWLYVILLLHTPGRYKRAVGGGMEIT